MEITFYNTSNDKRVVSKTLTSGTTLQCELYDECNIITPKLLIEFTTDIFSKNYCYIPTFGRYYFITNMKVDAGERIIIECGIDALYTYRNSIYSLDVTVVRNENFSDRCYLVDPMFTISPKRNIEVYAFENTPFNIRDASGQSANFVLVMGGGYGS